jgi:hypothetical protein
MATPVPDDDVTPARGVLLSDSAAREIAAALDHLGRLAAPRGMQLSERLRTIRRELLTSTARGITHARVSADDIVAQSSSELDASVVNTTTAAQVLGMTPGGVTWLCRHGRLAATRCGGRWLIDTAALRNYQRERLER